MKFPRPCPAALVLGLGCLLVPTGFGQGPLTPPGTPTPTMKTLDQIASSGIAINAINTPGDGANLYIISAPGSYYLTGNITGVNGKRGILLNSTNVTIDLNGFEMIGVPGSGVGISDGGVNQGNATIRNGTIRGWGLSGIYLATSFDSLIHDLIVANNGQDGITGGDACHIRECVFRDNGFSGVVTGFNANIARCTAVGSATGAGFKLGQDSSLSECVANFNFTSGVVAALACTISNCTANENLAAGISTDNNCQVTCCTAYNNSAGGINCGGFCNVANCNASQNKGSTSSAIFISGGTVSNCSACNNSLRYGIEAIFGSTIVHCTASFNTSDQTTSAGIHAPGCTVENCTTNNNMTTNASPSSTAGMGIFSDNTDTLIQDCNSSFNKGDGIRAVSRNVVKDNLAGENGGAGVHLTGDANRIEGNHVAGNTVGILVDATVNLVLRNQARGNVNNFTIVAGNRVATIILPATNAAINGSTGGTAFSTDAAVNIGY